MGDTGGEGWQERTGNGRIQLGAGRTPEGQAAVVSGPWSDFGFIPCRDGKQRRIERGTFPLVAGLPRGVGHGRDYSVPITPEYTQATAEARVMRLRGYGNAIVPQLAATFVRAFLETET